MRDIAFPILLFIATFALYGCGTTGRLGLVTRSSVDPESLLKSGKAYRELGPAWGKVCGSNGMGMPADNFANVVDDALEHVDADALINVTTSTHREPYLPIVMFIPLPGKWCTRVQGTAIRFIGNEERSTNPSGDTELFRTYKKLTEPMEGKLLLLNRFPTDEPIEKP